MIKAAVFAMIPLAAQAGGWDAFQARCIDAFENLSLPVVAGLPELTERPPGQDEAGYALSDTEALVLELAPDDGEMACRLEDQTGQAGLGFDAWITEGVKTERYEEVGDGHWQSYEWVEPVVAVQKWDEGGTVVLRILVTDLES
ncbi:MAG: hypothetical protein L3J36_14570 [Rhodobacteraceae bacterium]|nr:hypothetical protein [Paracoccaceae bacterium]